MIQEEFLMHPLVATIVRNGFWKIGKRKDLTINLRHIMNFGKGPFEIKILNNGEMVHDLDRFIAVAAKYV